MTDRGCHNCETQRTVPMCNLCGDDDWDSWEPDAMVKLSNHIEEFPWSDLNGVQAVGFWAVELKELFNEVQERYRRD